MHTNMDRTEILPDEILLFQNTNMTERDPIKREVIGFSESAYIINNIVPFPVDINDYFYYRYQDKRHFFSMLALSYIAQKLKGENRKIDKIYLGKDDLLASIYFITNFFEFDDPLSNKSNYSKVWIYPKLSLRKFVADSVKNRSFNNLYIDDKTLDKLVMIMDGFVRYEYSNADENIVDKIEALNHPTLVLANIKLYEKGILKLIESKEGIGIKIELHPNSGSYKIFTKEIEKLKKKILHFANGQSSQQYTLKDFIE